MASRTASSGRGLFRSCCWPATRRSAVNTDAPSLHARISCSDSVLRGAGTPTPAASGTGGIPAAIPAAAAPTTTAASRPRTSAGRATPLSTSQPRRSSIVPDAGSGPRRAPGARASRRTTDGPAEPATVRAEHPGRPGGRPTAVRRIAADPGDRLQPAAGQGVGGACLTVPTICPPLGRFPPQDVASRRDGDLRRFRAFEP